MKKYNLLCTKFTTRSRKYSSYKGEVGKIADNELNRAFNVNQMNEVYVSDVTEFKVDNSDVKVYLSPIMDLYNSEIVSFSISTSPTVRFVCISLEKAIEKLPIEHNLMIHTDQGFQYQHGNWTQLLEQNNIKQSMSRRGNCLDNSPMENFFSLLKQEIYYGVKYQSVQELIQALEEYIDWYNNRRIKEKLNGLSPVQYRKQAI